MRPIIFCETQQLSLVSVVHHRMIPGPDRTSLEAELQSPSEGQCSRKTSAMAAWPICAGLARLLPGPAGPWVHPVIGPASSSIWLWTVPHKDGSVLYRFPVRARTAVSRKRMDKTKMRTEESTKEERVVWEALGELLPLSPVWTVPTTPTPRRS